MFPDNICANFREKLPEIIATNRFHHAVNISFTQLFNEDPALARLLMHSPLKALKLCDKQLRNFIASISLSTSANLLQTSEISFHTRVFDLSYADCDYRIFPKTIEAPAFLQLTGTVVRTCAVKLLEYKRDYVCCKCKKIQTITAVYEQRFEIVAPRKCADPTCTSKKIIQKDRAKTYNCKDYQEIRLQEDVKALEAGKLPYSIWVTLEDDLVDSCKPGDAVTITGILTMRWKTPEVGKPLEVELVLQANHIRVTNDKSASMILTFEMNQQFHTFWETHKDNKLVGRNLILRSFCPQLYGMYLVKLAVAVVLAGGSLFPDNAQSKSACRLKPDARTQPHLLLVGDPGTGKSQLLRYATQIIPRSVITSGSGSTSAGLTVTAVMEEGQWQLEAGALVLSDGGICCIDEFNTMKEADRMSILEAMEQQTISVAKASIVCKLNTRCSILATANPKGPLDTSQSLSINLAMASPLLSRFDLILLLKDKFDEKWDRRVVDYILNGKQMALAAETSALWSLEMLQGYFAKIKELNPLLTEQSSAILSAYYQYQRRLQQRNHACTTVRLLESLIRLSQAHARLMFHRKVNVIDAVMAISLVESSMNSNCAESAEDLNSRGLFNPQADFPNDPVAHYRQIATIILERLNLNVDLLDFDDGTQVATRIHDNQTEFDDICALYPKTQSEGDTFEDVAKILEISQVSSIVDHLESDGFDRNQESTVDCDGTIMETFSFHDEEVDENLLAELEEYSQIVSTERVSKENKQITDEIVQNPTTRLQMFKEKFGFRARDFTDGQNIAKSNIEGEICERKDVPTTINFEDDDDIDDFDINL